MAEVNDKKSRPAGDIRAMARQVVRQVDAINVLVAELQQYGLSIRIAPEISGSTDTPIK
jgi:hypothetical protein